MRINNNNNDIIDGINIYENNDYKNNNNDKTAL